MGDSAVIVAAAETGESTFPDVSLAQLHGLAVTDVLAKTGLRPADIDGLACGSMAPAILAMHTGIRPSWIDGTSVGNCSTILNVSHAAAAIRLGMARRVLVVFAETLKSQVGVDWVVPPESTYTYHGQFEAPYGVGPQSSFILGLVRYMAEYNVSDADLAQVPVVQREWAALTDRARYRDPITVEDVLASPVYVHPLHRLEFSSSTDSGGAILLTSEEEAAVLSDGHQVFVHGVGEYFETSLASQVSNPIAPVSLRRSAEDALRRAGISPVQLDHLMLFDGFAHGVYFGLESLGICEPGTAPKLVSEGQTRPGGRWPTNTNGGFLSYRHGDMAQMQEAIRQLRQDAGRAQLPGVQWSLVQGCAPMFTGAATVVLGNHGR